MPSLSSQPLQSFARTAPQAFIRSPLDKLLSAPCGPDLRPDPDPREFAPDVIALRARRAKEQPVISVSLENAGIGLLASSSLTLAVSGLASRLIASPPARMPKFIQVSGIGVAAGALAGATLGAYLDDPKQAALYGGLIGGAVGLIASIPLH